MNAALLELINRDFNGGLTYGLPEQEVVSTGLPQLDAAIGGGVPRGRIVEIYGGEGSGKTALALHLAAQLPGPTFYVDADCGLSPHMLRGAGELYRLDVGTLEDTLDACLHVVRTGACGAVVIDTVAALPTDEDVRCRQYWAELDRRPARVLSRALPVLSKGLNRTGCTLILVNQLREKPGVMYGNPERPTGGKAISCYAALRLETRRGEAIKERGAVTGHVMRVRVTKNKQAPPGREAAAQLIYGVGLSTRDKRLKPRFLQS